MTAPFHRLLLATEHTEFDVGAERAALVLARRWATPLHGVLPLVSNPEYEALAPELAQRADAEAFDKLTRLRAAATDAGVELDIRVRHGQDPAQEIIAEAAERGADLVIVRRRGKRSLFAKLPVGAMVTKVATNAPCSVLLVSRVGHPWSSKIVVGVDTSEAARSAAATAAAVAADAGLPLLVASVAAPDDAARHAAAEAAVAGALEVARRCGASATGEVLPGGKPEERLAALAVERGADLIVVGRSGETGLVQRLLLGGTAHRVIGLASCPVLVAYP